MNPEVCQPTDPIFLHSRWSQEPSEQNQRLLDLVIWEHPRAAGREAGGMAGKHAMLPLVQAGRSSSPWQGTVWFTLEVLGSRNIDSWGHLYKDTLGYTTLCITPSTYMPSGVAFVLTWITQSDEGLLPAHLCSCQQYSVMWITLHCDSWFLPVSAKTFTPLQPSHSFVLQAQCNIWEWVLWKKSKQYIPWGSSGLQKDLCSQCKSQKC